MQKPHLVGASEFNLNKNAIAGLSQTATAAVPPNSFMSGGMAKELKSAKILQTLSCAVVGTVNPSGQYIAKIPCGYLVVANGNSTGSLTTPITASSESSPGPIVMDQYAAGLTDSACNFGNRDIFSDVLMSNVVYVTPNGAMSENSATLQAIIDWKNNQSGAPLPDTLYNAIDGPEPKQQFAEAIDPNQGYVGCTNYNSAPGDPNANSTCTTNLSKMCDVYQTNFTGGSDGAQLTNLTAIEYEKAEVIDARPLGIYSHTSKLATYSGGGVCTGMKNMPLDKIPYKAAIDFGVTATISNLLGPNSTFTNCANSSANATTIYNQFKQRLYEIYPSAQDSDIARVLSAELPMGSVKYIYFDPTTQNLVVTDAANVPSWINTNNVQPDGSTVIASSGPVDLLNTFVDMNGEQGFDSPWDCSAQTSATSEAIWTRSSGYNGLWCVPGASAFEDASPSPRSSRTSNIQTNKTKAAMARPASADKDYASERLKTFIDLPELPRYSGAGAIFMDGLKFPNDPLGQSVTMTFGVLEEAPQVNDWYKAALQQYQWTLSPFKTDPARGGYLIDATKGKYNVSLMVQSVTRKPYRTRIVLRLSVMTLSPGAMPLASALSKSQTNLLASIESMFEKEETISPELLSGLVTILESEPNNYRAHLLLGEYYEHLTLTDQAIEQYKLAAANAPNDPQALINLIKLQVRGGQLKAAGALVKEAKKRFPKDAQVNFWEGNFSFESDPNKAERDYLRAIHDNEQIVGLPTALAEIRLKQHRYMEAYLLASVDISHDKKFWTAYKIKGFAAFGMGNFREAVSLLSVAFDHFSGRSNSAKGLAMAALRSGRCDIGLEPALVNLGLTSSLTETSLEQKQLVIDLWRQVPLDEAREILARTEGLYGLPSNSSYHFAMGAVFDQLGLVPDAVLEYQRGLSVKPNYARGLYRLGRDLQIYYHRYTDALADYRLASRLAPSDGEISRSLDRLQIRLLGRGADLAWRLKDKLRKPSS
ncbi:unnamed protein product [Sphagnum balticum]